MSIRTRLQGEKRDAAPIIAVTLDDLPSPKTKRWVARRKAQVVSAVRSGLLTYQQACQRYGISGEEYESWERAMDSHGVGALRVTKIQDFRRDLANYAQNTTNANTSLPRSW